MQIQPSDLAHWAKILGTYCRKIETEGLAALSSHIAFLVWETVCTERGFLRGWHFYGCILKDGIVAGCLGGKSPLTMKAIRRGSQLGAVLAVLEARWPQIASSVTRLVLHFLCLVPLAPTGCALAMHLQPSKRTWILPTWAEHMHSVSISLLRLKQFPECFFFYVCVCDC